MFLLRDGGYTDGEWGPAKPLLVWLRSSAPDSRHQGLLGLYLPSLVAVACGHEELVQNGSVEAADTGFPSVKKGAGEVDLTPNGQWRSWV